MELTTTHIVIMVICLAALIISSETIKFYERTENFSDFNQSLLNSKKKNQYLFDVFSDEYKYAEKLEKETKPDDYNPFKAYNSWNKCGDIHYLSPGENFKKPNKEIISYCYPPDPVMNLPMYRILNTKEKCVSDVDLTNKPKIPGVWSPPCTKNKECPFYKSNKNYKNDFGKCIKGKCELPLGVVPIGNKHFIGDPLCHRCIDQDEPYKCCNEQKNKFLYENLLSPDYAFNDDEISRIKGSI